MRGAGIAAAGLIAISLCLTVTILELIKLNREAKAEAERKEAEAEAARKFSDGYRPSHAAQDSDEFWMYDELKTRVAPDSLRQKFVNGGSVTLKDKDSDKMLVSRRRGELQVGGRPLVFYAFFDGGCTDGCDTKRGCRRSA